MVCCKVHFILSGWPALAFGSSLPRSSPSQVTRSCSWARQFTLFTLVYKLLPSNLSLGSHPAMDWHSIQGEETEPRADWSLLRVNSKCPTRIPVCLTVGVPSRKNRSYTRRQLTQSFCIDKSRGEIPVVFSKALVKRRTSHEPKQLTVWFDSNNCERL